MSSLNYKNNFKSDIFNQDTHLTQKHKAQKKYINRSTDVLNLKEPTPLKRQGVIRNHSQSDIFLIQNQKEKLNYNINKGAITSRKEYISNYNPNTYLKCESAFNHKMKDIYDITEGSLKHIKTTKGYLARDDFQRNQPIRKFQEYREGYHRIGKKNLANGGMSHSAYFEGEDINEKVHKGSTIEFMKSNIFFNREKDDDNHRVVVLDHRSNRDDGCTFQYTQPKPRIKEQWHSTLDWKKGQTELILSSYYKNNTYRRAYSAFHRKINDMKGNDIFNTNTNKEQNEEEGQGHNNGNPLKRSRKCKPLNHSMTKREMKVSKNMSSQFTDDNFYTEAYKLRDLKEEDKPVQRYIIQHKGDLHVTELKHLFHDKGLQVNDISTSESSIIRDDSTPSFAFKVKGNNKETFDNKINEIKSKLSNEKGITINQQKYICVNKRDYSKKIEHDERKGLFKSNNDKNSMFSTNFYSINHLYKRK